MSNLPQGHRVADHSVRDLLDKLRAGRLVLDFGATSVRLHSDSATLAAQLAKVYSQHPLTDAAEWSDHHVSITRAGGWRRWIRPQVVFSADFQRPFAPFPADTALPLFEWGSNWLIGQRLAHLLLLHAGVLERDGFALILPATPGSGKSTLTAALSLRGWRLLSDEFGAFCPDRMRFIAMLKPVALKNQSIDVIRQFAPDAPLGPSFPKTRKGTVAHLAADRDAVDRRKEWVQPGAVVIPRWMEGAELALERLVPHVMFGALAFNAFNYQDTGTRGFEAVSHLTSVCSGWQLTYSRLDDAIEALDEMWQQVRRKTLEPIAHMAQE